MRAATSPVALPADPVVDEVNVDHGRIIADPVSVRTIPSHSVRSSRFIVSPIVGRRHRTNLAITSTDARRRLLRAGPTSAVHDGAMRDWVDWHRAYDDPASSLRIRLQRVRRHLSRAFDQAPALPGSGRSPEIVSTGWDARRRTCRVGAAGWPGRVGPTRRRGEDLACGRDGAK